MQALLVDRLLEVADLFHRDMARAFAGTELTTARVHLLWVVHGSTPQTQQSLATALGVTPRNVTGLVDALESAGYVRRTPHPYDRRATLVELTASAERMMTKMTQEHAALNAAVVEAVDPADREAFVRGVDAVVARLRALVDGAAE